MKTEINIQSQGPKDTTFSLKEMLNSPGIYKPFQSEDHNNIHFIVTDDGEYFLVYNDQLTTFSKSEQKNWNYFKFIKVDDVITIKFRGSKK